jgi:RimJ/RimL family protein N-acetyltransferase
VTSSPGALRDIWPLYGLRLRSGDLELRVPTEAELPAFIDVARAGVHPPGEMPFGVAWTDKPSPRFEREFYQFHMRVRSAWSPDDWNLTMGVWADGQPAGFQDLTATEFAKLRTVRTGSWLGMSFQGRGIGKRMRQAVLALAFDHLGAEVAESKALFENPASIRVSLGIGYEPNGFGRLAPRGEPRDAQRFRMTLEAWRARPRPEVVVEGLEGCLELFGVTAPA